MAEFQYEYFIVILTTHNKLVEGYYWGRNAAEALDKAIDIHSLGGQVADYRLTIRRERGLPNA